MTTTSETIEAKRASLNEQLEALNEERQGIRQAILDGTATLEDEAKYSDVAKSILQVQADLAGLVDEEKLAGVVDAAAATLNDSLRDFVDDAVAATNVEESERDAMVTRILNEYTFTLGIVDGKRAGSAEKPKPPKRRRGNGAEWRMVGYYDREGKLHESTGAEIAHRLGLAVYNDKEKVVAALVGKGESQEDALAQANELWGEFLQAGPGVVLATWAEEDPVAADKVRVNLAKGDEEFSGSVKTAKEKGILGRANKSRKVRRIDDTLKPYLTNNNNKGK